ncbi:MAG: 4-hydroxyphenylacetate 3-hydroxylase N-terminal domain-containing protein, partial [Parvibaculum sedimenti]
RRFYREVVEGDLSLTHTIIHPVVDKSLPDTQGVNGECALKVVRRTKDSIVVRGAKILATLGPFADELFVYPGVPQPPSVNPDTLLAFSIPMNTKGLITLCRDHYGVNSSAGDHPFSSRFDEQDAFMIFDDVEIPNERVFIDGDLDVYNGLMRHGWAANIMQQTCIRAAVKLEFAYELCTRMAQATNADKRPDTAALLGEIWAYSQLTRSAIAAAEAGAHDWGNGAFFPDDRPFRATRAMMPGWMVKANDAIKTIGSHNLLATPSLDAIDNPEIGHLIKTYMPGSNGMSARERAKLFRTAWDFAGSALGGRVELYERFYLASAPRNFALDHMFAQMEREWTEVPAMLKAIGVD